MADGIMMVSKRSSRAYIEDLLHSEDNTPHRSRRNSRQEDSIPDPVENPKAAMAREQAAPVESTIEISTKQVARPEIISSKGEKCETRSLKLYQSYPDLA